MAPPGSVTFSPVRIGSAAAPAPWAARSGTGAALGVFPWGFSFAPAAPTVAGTRAVQIPWWTQEAGAFRQSATFVAGASGYAMLADEIAANVGELGAEEPLMMTAGLSASGGEPPPAGAPPPPADAPAGAAGGGDAGLGVHIEEPIAGQFSVRTAVFAGSLTIARGENGLIFMRGTAPAGGVTAYWRMQDETSGGTVSWGVAVDATEHLLSVVEREVLIGGHPYVLRISADRVLHIAPRQMSIDATTDVADVMLIRPEGASGRVNIHFDGRSPVVFSGISADDRPARNLIFERGTDGAVTWKLASTQSDDTVLQVLGQHPAYVRIGERPAMVSVAGDGALVVDWRAASFANGTAVIHAAQGARTLIVTALSDGSAGHLAIGADGHVLYDPQWVSFTQAGVLSLDRVMVGDVAHWSVWVHTAGGGRRVEVPSADAEPVVISLGDRNLRLSSVSDGRLIVRYPLTTVENVLAIIDRNISATSLPAMLVLWRELREHIVEYENPNTAPERRVRLWRAILDSGLLSGLSARNPAVSDFIRDLRASAPR